MASTYTLISSNTLTSTAANITFSSIPSTYTDLVIKVSARATVNQTYNTVRMRFNGDTATNYSRTYVEGTGSTAVSSVSSNQNNFAYIIQNSALSTANTFGSGEIYISNYTSANNKVFFVNSAQEDNNTAAYYTSIGGLWRNSSAIDTILIYPSSQSFVSGSSFYLYGIKNS